jgi:hypothetical protein
MAAASSASTDDTRIVACQPQPIQHAHLMPCGSAVPSVSMPTSQASAAPALFGHPADHQLHAQRIDAGERQPDGKAPRQPRPPCRCASSAKPALQSAPSTAQTAKMRLAAKRSARPLSANESVPMMKPELHRVGQRTDIGNRASAQLRIRSSAALLAENHSEVPNNWARTMTGTAGFMTTYRERSAQDNLPGHRSDKSPVQSDGCLLACAQARTHAARVS